MQTHDVMARCISAVGVKEKVSVSGWMDRGRWRDLLQHVHVAGWLLSGEGGAVGGDMMGVLLVD